MTRISNTRIIRAKAVGQGEDFSEENFKIETVELDTTLNDGEILVRNLYISLDPCKPPFSLLLLTLSHSSNVHSLSSLPLHKPDTVLTHYLTRDHYRYPFSL